MRKVTTVPVFRYFDCAEPSANLAERQPNKLSEPDHQPIGDQRPNWLSGDLVYEIWGCASDFYHPKHQPILQPCGFVVCAVWTASWQQLRHRYHQGQHHLVAYTTGPNRSGYHCLHQCNFDLGSESVFTAHLPLVWG